MPLEVLRTQLISSGFHPEEVEYSLLEVLQYKKPESLNSTDFNILSGILENRYRKSRVQRVHQREESCNYHFGA